MYRAVPVRAPLPHVPVHVVQAPGVGLLLADGVRVPLLVAAVPPGRLRPSRDHRTRRPCRAAARHAYSHSASVGKRYVVPPAAVSRRQLLRRTPDRVCPTSRILHRTRSGPLICSDVAFTHLSKCPGHCVTLVNRPGKRTRCCGASPGNDRCTTAAHCVVSLRDAPPSAGRTHLELTRRDQYQLHTNAVGHLFRQRGCRCRGSRRRRRTLDYRPRCTGIVAWVVPTPQPSGQQGEHHQRRGQSSNTQDLVRQPARPARRLAEPLIDARARWPSGVGHARLGRGVRLSTSLSNGTVSTSATRSRDRRRGHHRGTCPQDRVDRALFGGRQRQDVPIGDLVEQGHRMQRAGRAGQD